MPTDKQIREYLEAQRQALEQYELRVPDRFDQYYGSNGYYQSLRYGYAYPGARADPEALIKKCFEAQLDDEDREYITITVTKQIANHGTEYLVQLIGLNGEAVETFVIEA